MGKVWEGHSDRLASGRDCADDPRGWTVSCPPAGEAGGVTAGQQPPLPVPLHVVSPGKSQELTVHLKTHL